MLKGVLSTIFCVACLFLFLFAQGNLLDESFEGAGYELGGGWAENVGGGSTVDEDSTAVSAPPSGETQVLKVQKVSPNFNASATYDDLPNEYDEHYATCYFQIAAEGLSDGEELPISQAYNSGGVVWEIRLKQFAGGDRKFYSIVYNDGGWDSSSQTVALNNDRWYRLDFKYDTGSTWEFRLDEAVIDSATLTGTLLDSPGYWRIGNQGTSETLTAYYDLVNVDSVGYVTFGKSVIFVGINFFAISLLFVVVKRRK